MLRLLPLENKQKKIRKKDHRNGSTRRDSHPGCSVYTFAPFSSCVCRSRHTETANAMPATATVKMQATRREEMTMVCFSADGGS